MKAKYIITCIYDGEITQHQDEYEVVCNKCNNTGWVCEWHPDKEAHKCCGGAGMPCECTKKASKK
jgi:hypothetical protein